MKNLKTYDEINEGFFIRNLYKIIFVLFITLLNIKRILKNKKTISYKLSIIISNLNDFMRPIKKNPDLVEFYDGNYFDIYKEKFGSEINDDISYLIDALNLEISEIKNKKMGIPNKEIDPYQEEEWGVLSSKEKIQLAKLQSNVSVLIEFNKIINEMKG